ncbi:MAG: O-acetyl-ADP-ribose deacetylase [Planctomycetes bacterium]|nr:O-acetyl-ADP-ribose deacetylase [Planctomycetota bacterium]
MIPANSNTLTRIEIVQGNIVNQQVDAIVNAANTTLLGGGGVDGAIHRAAGPELLAECRSLGGCPTGEARITSGYRLPARHVIHTVGPVYRDGRHREPELLASAYRSSLALAEEYRCRTLAFPAISTGAYGYPKEEAARIATSAVAAWLEEHALPEKVTFVLFSAEDYNIYEKFVKKK